MSLLRFHVAPMLFVAVTVGAARADCIDDAAAHHHVNALVLRAIGWQESRLDPAALGHNTNGSIDIGAFQINSAHLPDLARYGVTPRMLADGCVSAYVGAWHYRRQVERFGNTWTAIGAYHSRTPWRSAWYANRIASILMSWGALPGTALPYETTVTRSPDATADRRWSPARRTPTPAGPVVADRSTDEVPGRDRALFDALPAPTPER